MAGNSWVAVGGVGRMAAPGPMRTVRICFCLLVCTYRNC